MVPSPTHSGVVVKPSWASSSGEWAHCASGGVSASRILPMICEYMWSVSRVSLYASYRSSGQVSVWAIISRTSLQIPITLSTGTMS